MGHRAASRNETLGTLELQIASEPRRILIEAIGELDLASEPLLTRELRSAEANHYFSEIVLDLVSLRFMDSIGLRALLEAHVRSQANGTRLQVRAVANDVGRVLDISGVGDVLRNDGTLVVVSRRTG